ncbi:MAG: LUD domain-containing protein [Rhodovibrio sp.]|nr:LUD domain-containing protein [Rhodovibrio sp.]
MIVVRAAEVHGRLRGRLGPAARTARADERPERCRDLRLGNWPRTVNLITGPSRTADIEQTLQLGAHGPMNLHVLVVGAADADFGGEAEARG